MSGIQLQMAVSMTTTFGLLAQGAVDNLGGGFRGERETPDWVTFLLVIAVLLAALGGVWLVSRRISMKESGRYHNHRGLFRELCRAHQLGWSDRRLLLVAARQQGIAVPARMFLDPDRFEPERLKDLKAEQRGRVAELHETLFLAEEEEES